MRWAMVPSVDFSGVPMPAGADYAAGAAVDRPARHRRTTRRSGRPPGFAPTRGAARLGLLRPPDQLPRIRRLERAGRRPGIAGPGGAVRAQPGERVQRRRRDLGAQIPPGDLRRLPDHQGRMRSSALDFAYRDVLAAYRGVPARGAGGPADHPRRHSQGSLHLMRLLAGADRAARRRRSGSPPPM